MSLDSRPFNYISRFSIDGPILWFIDTQAVREYCIFIFIVFVIGDVERLTMTCILC